jgi:maleylpyruvate isomerase
VSGTEQRIAEIVSAETRLATTVRRLDEDALREPSLCEGWTRGHVLAHVALNAHSLVNLFGWARTGEENPQYPSAEAREADIERNSTFTLPQHLEALEESSQSFHAAARAVPADRWDFPISGIGGSPQPASDFLFGRLREIEVHHVDLDASYDSSDWPDGFVRESLDGVPGRFEGRVEPFEIEATDLGVRLAFGDGPMSTCVTGRGHEIFLWLLGRDPGTNLRTNEGALPQLPSWG